jgi:hypothetical protein
VASCHVRLSSNFTQLIFAALYTSSPPFLTVLSQSTILRAWSNLAFYIEQTGFNVEIHVNLPGIFRQAPTDKQESKPAIIDAYVDKGYIATLFTYPQLANEPLQKD